MIMDCISCMNDPDHKGPHQQNSAQVINGKMCRMVIMWHDDAKIVYDAEAKVWRHE